MTEDLRHLAVTTATTAAQFAWDRRCEGVEVAAAKSSPVDIVTEADRATERLIRELILSARPNDGILGEEGSVITGTSGLTWVIDPIDGTVNYLYDIPAWAVSIAVVEGEPNPATWETLAGAVVNPRADEVYSAALEAGATLNGQPIRASDKSDLATALIATGFAYASEARALQADALTHILSRIRDIRRMGACSLDLCAVASGRVDGYFERTVSPWDHAAGALVAREAGALVSGAGDAREGRALVLAAAPGIFSALADLVDEASEGQVWE